MEAVYSSIKALCEPLATKIGAPWWVVPVAAVVVFAIVF